MFNDICKQYNEKKINNCNNFFFLQKDSQINTRTKTLSFLTSFNKRKI